MAVENQTLGEGDCGYPPSWSERWGRQRHWRRPSPLWQDRITAMPVMWREKAGMSAVTKVDMKVVGKSFCQCTSGLEIARGVL